MRLEELRCGNRGDSYRRSSLFVIKEEVHQLNVQVKLGKLSTFHTYC